MTSLVSRDLTQSLNGEPDSVTVTGVQLSLSLVGTLSHRRGSNNRNHTITCQYTTYIIATSELPTGVQAYEKLWPHNLVHLHLILGYLWNWKWHTCKCNSLKSVCDDLKLSSLSISITCWIEKITPCVWFDFFHWKFEIQHNHKLLHNRLIA